ncbi:Rhs element Vgr protein [Yersinia intermedia]|uniref:Rhs element Vgr protein n=1 Tax=Yersinia intermedia TaxID=631 RepID=A0A0H5MHG7_YERIN|nr:type VI secretion system tip protein TssI/VgrG [Yersinia intermedia]CRY56516.1 Rhs element Vgr protein [Yersinia intermedia]
MSVGQDKRFIRWVGNMADDMLLLELTGEESISQPYRYHAHFSSSLTSAQLNHYLGQDVSCQIGDSDRGRYVHGVLTAMQEDNDSQGVSHYTAVIEPRMALLRLGCNLRVFQNLNVPDLVCQLLREHNIKDIDVRLRSEYQKREYCLQYRESDFNFISRLLEQEGIYYFFLHKADKHTLVLADHSASHPVAKPRELPFYPQLSEQGNMGVHRWEIHRTLAASSVKLLGFNILQAQSIESETRSNNHDQAVDSVSYVDFLGYEKRDLLSTTAQVKIEQLEAGTQLFRGEIKSYWLNCGEIFSLSEHPSCRGNYRIKSLSLRVSSNVNGDQADYGCSIIAMDGDKKYRAESCTPIPIVSGIMTAKVVGPNSEEIHTDEYGRIKIQFHWDRENQTDDSSSCWVRVSQPWTGVRFGALFLPRVGSEVIVSFVQGDVDYPLVTGAVFNGENKPPFTLPEQKHVTGFTSRSSQNGTVEQGHILSFDDSKDAEKLSITSQKDLLLTVKNDITTDIQHAVNTTIGADRATEITKGNDSLILKQGDHSTTLDQGNYQLTIKGDLTTQLQGGDHQLKVSGGGSELSADKSCLLESTQGIELKVGNSKISITPVGITLTATTIKIESSATAELKAAMVTVQGSGMTQVKGGVVMIG